MHRTATTITLTTIALALAVSVPAHAKKKSSKKAEKEKAEKAEKASSTASDDLWFEAPLATAPVERAKPTKADKKKAKKAKETPRYGHGLGLHNARNKREAPKVEERAEDMSRKLTQSEIRRVIRGHHRSISFCGRRAAKKGERASQVLLRFQVDSKGTPRDVSITDVKSKALPHMTTCMRRASRGWKFPADTSGGDIEYPLMLNRR